MIGIAIRPYIGVGDGVQFSSVPENYFRHTGEKLHDINRPWFFDHNPFVIRDSSITPHRIQEMWNFGPTQYEWPSVRPHKVYLSNAEIHASVFKVPVVLNRPRLYQYEDFPFAERESILFHVDGRSHGVLPDKVIEHVLKKYTPTKRLYQIGTGGPDLGIPRLVTTSLWDLAKFVSEARMLIGVDSGPSWIAACYPDVVVKKVRVKPSKEEIRNWVPLEERNIHSHWDDRCHQMFNIYEDDIGFTSSYRKL